MKLAIMQPYFFPYIGYFQLIAAVDKFILYSHVNYIKKGWINRNRLLRVHEAPFYITVPLMNASSFDPIYTIRICNSSQWKRKMLRDIYFNYRRSPYFEQVMLMVENLFCTEVEYLSEFNVLTIGDICSFLDIQTSLITDRPYFSGLEESLQAPDSVLNINFRTERQLIDQKAIRIIRICELEGAESYINPIGGQALYNRQVFLQNGVELSFVQTGPYIYQQNARQFFQHLSIIDVLMNCGKEGTKQLLEKYTLIQGHAHGSSIEEV